MFEIKNKNNLISFIVALLASILVVCTTFTPYVGMGLEGSVCVVLIFWLLHILNVQKIKLKHTQIEYKRNKEILEDILVYTPDLIYYKNLHSEIIGCNKSFCRFFDYKPEEIVGSTFFQFFTQKDIEAILVREAQVIETKQTVQYEITLSRKNKQDVYLEVTKSPLYDENDNVTGTAGVCRDVTALKMKEKETKTFNETLTHDLKTPVLAQIKALEFLLSENIGTLNEEQKLLIKQTISSSKFVQEMMNCMLSIHKFGSNSYELKPSKFNIKDIVSNYVEETYYLAFNKNIKIETDFSALKNPEIVADKLSIQRVITNLIFNAITYSLENSILKVAIESKNGDLKFKVQNQTSKSFFNREDINKMFDKYAVAKTKFRQIGSGLGLYLSKQIVDTHNGHVFGDVIKDDSKNYDLYEFGFEIPTNNNKINNKPLIFR